MLGLLILLLISHYFSEKKKYDMHVKMKRTAKPEVTALVLHVDFCFQPCSFGKTKEVYGFYYVFKRYGIHGPVLGFYLPLQFQDYYKCCRWTDQVGFYYKAKNKISDVGKKKWHIMRQQKHMSHCPGEFQDLVMASGVNGHLKRFFWLGFRVSVLKGKTCCVCSDVIIIISVRLLFSFSCFISSSN